MAGRQQQQRRSLSSSGSGNRINYSNSAGKVLKPKVPLTPLSSPATSATIGTVLTPGSRMQTMLDMISGCKHGARDKTICQYCGVSYLTMSELKALQATVKEQEEKLTYYKQMMEENSRLKEELETTKKTFAIEIKNVKKKYGHGLDLQIIELKKQLQDAQAINVNLTEKCANATDDFKQQAELISSLRYQLATSAQEVQSPQATIENSILRKKIVNLEETLQNLLVRMKLKQTEDQGMFGDSIANRNRNEDSSPGPRSSSSSSLVHAEEASPSTSAAPSAAVAGRKKKPKATAANSSSSSLSSIEIHDLRKVNASLNDKLRNLTQEHSTCHDMHNFLRETVDKLKADNKHLHENMNGLKIKFEEAVIELENLDVQLQRTQTENTRLKQNTTELETKLNSILTEHNNLKIEKSTQQLEAQLKSLQKECLEKDARLETLRLNYEEKLTAANSNLNVEKERADSCLRAIIAEREDVEKRWEERWSRHQTSLNEQLDSLKTSYEQSVTSAKELEEGLQKDLLVVQKQFDDSKAEWEAFKVALDNEIAIWRTKYESKCTEFEALQKVKEELSRMLEKKNLELDSLHEIIHEGCEERQELQMKIESLERNDEEFKQNLLFQRRTSFMNFNNNPSATSSVTSFCTAADSASTGVVPTASSNVSLGLGLGLTTSTSTIGTSIADNKVIKSALKRGSVTNIVKDEPMIFTVGKPKSVSFALQAQSSKSSGNNNKIGPVAGKVNKGAAARRSKY